eukprot:gnl/Trimastix_PCT/2821.p1 GENE.gnl/Trimastix_PCT/2821~~gnl/Trimastix_PCT/2821.p1  ORF type:complete len:478 (+),score=97.40 gnl/Trimastix_PCT/2821:45-1478(+)
MCCMKHRACASGCFVLFLSMTVIGTVLLFSFRYPDVLTILQQRTRKECTVIETDQKDNTVIMQVQYPPDSGSTPISAYANDFHSSQSVCRDAWESKFEERGGQKAKVPCYPDLSNPASVRVYFPYQESYIWYGVPIMVVFALAIWCCVSSSFKCVLSLCWALFAFVLLGAALVFFSALYPYVLARIPPGKVTPARCELLDDATTQLACPSCLPARKRDQCGQCSLDSDCCPSTSAKCVEDGYDTWIRVLVDTGPGNSVYYAWARTQLRVRKSESDKWRSEYKAGRRVRCYVGTQGARKENRPLSGPASPQSLDSWWDGNLRVSGLLEDPAEAFLEFALFLALAAAALALLVFNACCCCRRSCRPARPPPSPRAPSEDEAAPGAAGGEPDEQTQLLASAAGSRDTRSEFFEHQDQRRKNAVLPSAPPAPGYPEPPSYMGFTALGYQYPVNPFPPSVDPAQTAVNESGYLPVHPSRYPS